MAHLPRYKAADSKRLLERQSKIRRHPACHWLPLLWTVNSGLKTCQAYGSGRRRFYEGPIRRYKRLYTTITPPVKVGQGRLIFHVTNAPKAKPSPQQGGIASWLDPSPGRSRPPV
jgi:hypothetical protein